MFRLEHKESTRRQIPGRVRLVLEKVFRRRPSATGRPARLTDFGIWFFRTTRLSSRSLASSAANFHHRNPIGTRRRLRPTMHLAHNIRNWSATRDSEVNDDTRREGRRTLHARRAVIQRWWRPCALAHNVALERNAQSCIERTIAACIGVGAEHRDTVSFIGRNV